MNTPFSFTICGIAELPEHAARNVTHVLSLLDPGWPEIEAFDTFDDHHRVILHFDDVIEPKPGKTPPQLEDVARILELGADMLATEGLAEGHLLIHCHMGVSRSTAAMVSLLAQAFPDDSEEAVFERLRAMRPQAWPNSRMIADADALLGRDGRMVEALRRHYAIQLDRDPRFQEWMTKLERTAELEMAVRP